MQHGRVASGLLGGRWGNPSRMDRNYVIMTEHWCADSIYDQFTTMMTVDKIIYANASKAPKVNANICH